MKGDATKERILDQAVDLASLEGLEGLTIGRLAALTGMSKSGLFAHFGAKGGLQLATIEAARRRYHRRVMEPILAAPVGLPRLLAACRGTLDYLASGVFPGGCFFVHVRAEYNARPGVVREAIRRNKTWMRKFLATTIRAAQARGDLAPTEDPDRLAFELEALWDAPNWALHDDHRTQEIERARLAIEARLTRARVARAAI